MLFDKFFKLLTKQKMIISKPKQTPIIDNKIFIMNLDSGKSITIRKRHNSIIIQLNNTNDVINIIPNSKTKIEISS